MLSTFTDTHIHNITLETFAHDNSYHILKEKRVPTTNKDYSDYHSEYFGKFSEYKEGRNIVDMGHDREIEPLNHCNLALPAHLEKYHSGTR